jgi:hypothetical protein
MSLTISENQTANVIAANLIQQWNNLATQTANLLANGRPAQGSFAAITAADLATALGSNLTSIQTALASINPPIS